MKAPPVKVVKNLGNLFSPSIKNAISGKVQPEKTESGEKKEEYNEYTSYSEAFTPDQLAQKWKEYLKLIADRPNMCSTLANVPEIGEGNKLILKIGNSVQEEDVRLEKINLLSWLRKELRNSDIELVTQIEKIESERMFYSDSEKLQLMMQKNPVLNDLKQKFNLDFQG